MQTANLDVDASDTIDNVKELDFAEHETPDLMAARREFRPSKPFKEMDLAEHETPDLMAARREFRSKPFKEMDLAEYKMPGLMAAHRELGRKELDLAEHEMPGEFWPSKPFKDPEFGHKELDLAEHEMPGPNVSNVSSVPELVKRGVWEPLVQPVELETGKHEIETGKSSSFSPDTAVTVPIPRVDGVKAKVKEVMVEKEKDNEAAHENDKDKESHLHRLHRPLQPSLSDDMCFEQFMNFMKWKYPAMNEDAIGDAFDLAAPGGGDLSLVKAKALVKKLEKQENNKKH